jgi:predicted amidophosphoribosyltransferase
MDDVYTTGATANECAKVLLKGGSKQVDVLTLARAM